MIFACRIDSCWSMNGCHLEFMMFVAVVIVEVGVIQISEDLVLVLAAFIIIG